MANLDSMISNLPLVVTNVIKSYLSLPDAINACLNIPRWNRMLYQKSTRQELDKYVSSMTWFDRNICECLLKVPSPSVYDVCSTILHHHKQTAYLNSILNNLPSSFSKKALKCLITGPAVDNLGCLDQFFTTLFEAYFDLAQVTGGTTIPLGLTANGLPIRTLIGSGEVLLGFSTLHARTRSQRTNITSRIEDSLILDINGLRNNITALISSSEFVFYMIDCRPGHLNWEEISFELGHICRCLSDDQSLFIVGVIDVDSSASACLCEMAKILYNEANGLLKEANFDWRLLSFQRGSENPANVFQWACFKAATKRKVDVTKPTSWLSSLLSAFL